MSRGLGLDITASIYLEQLIAKRLEELLPGFDPVILDNKLYKTCIDDSVYYMAVNWHLNIKDVRYKFNEVLEDKGLEFKDELDAWLAIWLIHWRKRVKIMFNSEEYNRHLRQIQKLKIKSAVRISAVDAKNFRAPVIETLIQHKEICFVSLLADQLIAQTRRAYSRKSLKTNEDKLNFLNLILKRVRDLSRTLGPTVFIKVEEGYFGRADYK